ncbi:threonyl-tRNA synthetase [Striga asiatica]|uniref:Threonyl-tRNA synthetase n=1 Tax=Striga asiatica TaxID=4170 RepID=A0A5A7Q7S7_STRAF|nr:threonyl-tRNA synthetase [Striga asiatica]
MTCNVASRVVPALAIVRSNMATRARGVRKAQSPSGGLGDLYDGCSSIFDEEPLGPEEFLMEPLTDMDIPILAKREDRNFGDEAQKRIMAVSLPYKVDSKTVYICDMVDSAEGLGLQKI